MRVRYCFYKDCPSCSTLLRTYVKYANPLMPVPTEGGELCSVSYSRRREKSTKLIRLLVLCVFLATGPYKPPLIVRFCPDCNSASCFLSNRIFVPSLGLKFPQLHEPPLAGRFSPGGLGSRTLHCVCYFLSLSLSQIGRQKRGAPRGLCGGGSGVEMRHSCQQPHTVR